MNILATKYIYREIKIKKSKFKYISAKRHRKEEKEEINAYYFAFLV